MCCPLVPYGGTARDYMLTSPKINVIIKCKGSDYVKCSVEGCDNKYFAKNYCSIHYQRFRKYGDPTMKKKNRNVFKHPVGTIMPETRISSNGNNYLRIKVSDTGVKDTDWRYHHRVIMEDHLCRKLKATEIVHHIDGNKGNNNISNLKVIDRPKHATTHFSKPRKFSEDMLINDIQRVAKMCKGSSLSAHFYNKQGITHSNTILHRFGSWNNGKKIAGVI